MTEISLIVTLNKQFNSIQLNFGGGGGCSSTKLHIRESREIFERGCRAAGGCRTYSLS